MKDLEVVPEERVALIFGEVAMHEILPPCSPVTVGRTWLDGPEIWRWLGMKASPAVPKYLCTSGIQDITFRNDSKKEPTPIKLL